MDRTDSKNSTPAARGCSADVRALTAMRARHGADSAIGHRCSNLVEQIRTYGKTRDEGTRARLEKNIHRQMTDLAGLTA
jgi:hypothetical protein